MANFLPLKRYMWYCLDRMIERYHLQPPFLDVGCGRGDVSEYVARRNWYGDAIDFSERAIAYASETLSRHPQVRVRVATLEEIRGTYRTVFLWDVLEHLEHDVQALKSIASLLHPEGYLVIAVPSNPREWRWDDEFYGHCRRYAEQALTQKLAQAGLQPLCTWDFTFPLFWAMRRLYTSLKPPPHDMSHDPVHNTKVSATINAWDMSLFSRTLDRTALLWRLWYPVQFTFFRHQIARGHEMFMLVKKAT